MAALEKPVGEYETVKLWFEDYVKYWGQTPEANSRLRILERFCEFVGQDPDTIIKGCFRMTEEGKRIRLKQRRFYMGKINEFEKEAPGDARQAGNIVRSFFLHNGVAMSADILS